MKTELPKKSLIIKERLDEIVEEICQAWINQGA
jgi:hypothetical protein